MDLKDVALLVVGIIAVALLLIAAVNYEQTYTKLFNAEQKHRDYHNILVGIGCSSNKRITLNPG